MKMGTDGLNGHGLNMVERQMITRGFTGRQRAPDIAKRLPPGQSLTEDFPVLSAGPTPHISTEDWTFTLKVGPRAIAKWTWAEFNALPQTWRSPAMRRGAQRISAALSTPPWWRSS